MLFIRTDEERKLSNTRPRIQRFSVVFVLLVLSLAMTAQTTVTSGGTSTPPTVVHLVLTYWGWIPSVRTIPPGPVVFVITNQTMLPSMALSIQTSAAGTTAATQPQNVILAEQPASAAGTTRHNATFTTAGSYSLATTTYPAFNVALTVGAP